MNDLDEMPPNSSQSAFDEVEKNDISNILDYVRNCRNTFNCR